jgi:hypothetical protein
VSAYSAALDHESLKPEKHPTDVRGLFDGLDPAKGDALICFGWAMAEHLAKLA